MTNRVDAKKVARRLRAVMADQELETVQDLAKFLGAERSQVSNWLNGYNLPPAHWMDVLCSQCSGLTLDWLYRGVADAVPTKLAIKLEALFQDMKVPLLPDTPDAADGRPRRKGRATGPRRARTEKYKTAT